MSGTIASFKSLPKSLQCLSPSQAHFCLSTLRFIEKKLDLQLAGTRILVALSGGADSSSLLLCLHYLSQKAHFSLCAAHLDHALRPSSGTEAEWCRMLCEHFAIPFFTKRSDIAAISRIEKKGIEETARDTRYRWFESLAEEEKCDWIATGHNKNDLAEDILMRLIRGAGWPGLGGMHALIPAKKILRPLLMHPRKEIEQFLQELNIVWLEDESNADQAYLRNRVRNTLLPLILAENPAFIENIAGLWTLARIDEDFYAQLPSFTGASETPGGNCSEPSRIFTDINELKDLPQAIRLRLYKHNLDKLGNGQALLDNLLRLDAGVMDAARGVTGKGSRLHQFPGGKRALISSKGILWGKN